MNRICKSLEYFLRPIIQCLALFVYKKWGLFLFPRRAFDQTFRSYYFPSTTVMEGQSHLSTSRPAPPPPSPPRQPNALVGL